MILPLLGRVLVATAITISTTATINHPSYAGSKSKFSCTKLNGIPVTMVKTSRGNEPMIRWVDRGFISSGYTPQERCQTVSTKFQRYYDNGKLYLTGRDNLNGYPVLCIANRQGASCSPENVLVTLKPGTDPGAALQQILDFRRSAKTPPVELSGSQSVSYVDGNFYLDLKQIVDTADN
ncbi:MAG: COP23 domain-containing protein [Rhizonema sp. NSF051]|nr:COP23 domain-containing protein [Rhizonema sp. NSF051]